jgi:hypothetical protein
MLSSTFPIGAILHITSFVSLPVENVQTHGCDASAHCGSNCGNVANCAVISSTLNFVAGTLLLE